MSITKDELPREAPPLFAMEEPAAFHAEPADEPARAALPAGSFSGVVLGEARTSLDAMLAEPDGVLVASVVENSPADAAGIEEGDLLLSVARVGEPGEGEPLHWPSEWRKLEIETPPGTRLVLLVDRAGAERTVELTLAARVRPAPRQETERWREEQRVGVVLRTATEVEARAAGLGPGGGVVVVGLTRESPWRAAGIVYGDLIVSVDGREIAHPEVLLEAVHAAPEDGALELAVVRGGERLTIRAPVSQRASEVTEFTIPLIFSYEAQRDEHTTSILLGLFRYRSTAAAWDLRLLWLIKFGGGDSDRLETVDA